MHFLSTQGYEKEEKIFFRETNISKLALFYYKMDKSLWNKTIFIPNRKAEE